MISILFGTGPRILLAQGEVLAPFNISLNTRQYDSGWTREKVCCAQININMINVNSTDEWRCSNHFFSGNRLTDKGIISMNMSSKEDKSYYFREGWKLAKKQINRIESETKKTLNKNLIKINGAFTFFCVHPF